MKLHPGIVLVLGCCLALSATDAKPKADVLNRWVGGKWVGEGKFVDSDYSKANKVSGVTKCAWSPDHVFVICDQDVNFGGSPMRDLSIYAFNPATGKFNYSQVNLSGERPRTGDLEINSDGDRWTYLGSMDDHGKTVRFRTTNQFHGNDQVEWWSEFSADGGKTWIKTGEGKETRQR